ncbi:hypothetical protein CCMA1212_003014 [Trichoderma ghanense]|uniref:Uncharacterized protein n=1 Tax=Trichoderma ghanense TaxID=65468 RepID=A0ABY2HAL1_9HYPO
MASTLHTAFGMLTDFVKGRLRIPSHTLNGGVKVQVPANPPESKAVRRQTSPRGAPGDAVTLEPRSSSAGSKDSGNWNGALSGDGQEEEEEEEEEVDVLPHSRRNFPDREVRDVQDKRGITGIGDAPSTTILPPKIPYPDESLYVTSAMRSQQNGRSKQGE